MSAPESPRPLESLLPRLARAIDDVLVAGHGQRSWLRGDHPPFSASLAEAVGHYGSGAALDLWVVCRSIEALRLIWTGKPGLPVEPASLQRVPEHIVAPDEGAPLPPPDPSEGQQRRLLGNGADHYPHEGEVAPSTI